MSDVGILTETFDEQAKAAGWIAEQVAALDSPLDVIRVRCAYYEARKAIHDLVDAELTKRFIDLCNLARGATYALTGGRMVLRPEVEVEGKRYYPTVTKDSERWDGPALVSRVAAVLADQAVDKETGEVLPPHEFAALVAESTAKVLGGLAPSTKWRTSYLGSLGIKNVSQYRTYEAGNPKIGEAA